MAKKSLGPSTHLFPMPALLIAVKTGEGRANIVTIAWAGIVAGEPPMLALDIAADHYSTPFIEREGNFSVNIPRSGQAMLADYCGVVSGHRDANKPATCGFTMVPSSKISSPLIAECPLNFECRLVRRIEEGNASFMLAEILETHVDEDVLNVAGEPDAGKLDPLIFTPDSGYYKLGERVAEAFSVGKELDRRSRGK